MSDTFVTPVCRASYPHLFKAYKHKDAKPTDEPQYEIVMLFPKTPYPMKDPNGPTIEKLHACIVAARDAKWPNVKDHANIIPNSYLRDGDESDKPEYAGHWYIKAKSTRKPKVMDQNVNVIEDVEHERVYPGCRVVVAVSTYAWTYADKKGIKLNLEHVQLIGDDEAFITRSDPNEVFSPVDVEAMGSTDAGEYIPPPAQQPPPPTQAPPADEAPPWS